MMGGVRDSSNQHPCTRSLHIKEFRFRLPPTITFRPQRRQPLSAVLGVALHEFQPALCRWQGRRANVNSQHVDEPEILAHALVHHLFAHAAPSRIPRAWPHRKILVAEFTPNAYHFHALGFVRFNQEVICHKRHPSTENQWTFSPPTNVAST